MEIRRCSRNLMLMLGAFLPACGHRWASPCAKLPDASAVSDRAPLRAAAAVVERATPSPNLANGTLEWNLSGWHLSDRFVYDKKLYAAVAANRKNLPCDEIVRVAMEYAAHVAKDATPSFAAGQCYRIRRTDGAARGLLGLFAYDPMPKHDPKRMRDALEFLHVRLDGRPWAAWEAPQAYATWKSGSVLVGEVAGYAYESHPGLLHSTSSEPIVGNYYGVAVAHPAIVFVLELQTQPCNGVENLRAEAATLLTHTFRPDPG